MSKKKPRHTLSISVPFDCVDTALHIMREQGTSSPEDGPDLVELVAQEVPTSSEWFIIDRAGGSEIPIHSLPNFRLDVWTTLTLGPAGMTCHVKESSVTIVPESWPEWYADGKTIEDVVAELAGDEWHINIEPPLRRRQALEYRAGTILPKPRKLTCFNISTSQEIDAFLQSAADGKRGDRWADNPQAGSRVWNGNLSHFVRINLTPAETDLSSLIALTEAQDADSCLIALYTLNALAPECPLAMNLRRGEWIDLLDVARKTGILTREGKREREEAVRKVWNTLLFGARAEVCGQRTTTYYDKKTNQVIPTQVESPVWVFGGRERQAQRVLFDALEIPLRAEIILTKDWEHLLFDANLTQYLPCGEKIGSIPAGKPSGAWARVIGLVLMKTWRREPQKALAGTQKIKRRDLLYRYIPSKSAPDELETNPQRAIEYWLEALKHLHRKGIVERAGEVTRTIKDIRQGIEGYGWLNPWLDEAVDIRPGPAIRPAIERQAAALPKSRPRVLGPKRKSRKTPKNH